MISLPFTLFTPFPLSSEKCVFPLILPAILVFIQTLKSIFDQSILVCRILSLGDPTPSWILHAGKHFKIILFFTCFKNTCLGHSCIFLLFLGGGCCVKQSHCKVRTCDGLLWASSSRSRELEQQTGAISLGSHCYSFSFPYTGFDCLLKHNEEVRVKPHSRQYGWSSSDGASICRFFCHKLRYLKITCHYTAPKFWHWKSSWC